MLYNISFYSAWLSVIFFVLTVSNFIAKKIVEKYEEKLKKSPLGNLIYIILFRYIMRFGHKNLGYLTLFFILIHASINLFSYGIINFTGILTLLFMIIQIIVGIFAVKYKHFKEGKYLFIHRILTIFLIVLVLIHIYYPWIINNYFS